MKEHPFCLYTNSTSLLSVLSPWKCGVLKARVIGDVGRGFFFVVLLLFAFEREVLCPT